MSWSKFNRIVRQLQRSSEEKLGHGYYMLLYLNHDNQGENMREIIFT